MNTLLWIITGLAAFAFLGSGAMKITSSKEKLLANKNMGWAADYSSTQIKMIGLAEVLGALGLVLPRVFDIATGLSAAAAIGLFLLMAGAANVHRKRNEPFAPALILGIWALISLLLK